MSKALIFKSLFDGKEMQIEVTDEFGRLYRAWGGKCWSAWCRNSATLIHFSRSGKADRAYCEHVEHDTKRLVDGVKYGGSWWAFIGGKMKELKVDNSA